ncbi:MAG: hypothetical protein J3K34DRAFT_411402 [Monoraphidium minutum]|nr:MAG: hypothetical protein J3K34DRAFT_411402 [Monoraphidium minutum]
MSGALTRPTAAQMAPTDPVPVSGSISIVFPQDPCPTQAELQGALQSAYLATPKGWPGLAMPAVKGVITGPFGMKVANATAEGFQGVFWSDPAAGARGTAAPNFLATSGVAKVQSNFGNVPDMPLATGDSMAMRGANCQLAAGAGGAVRLACPGVQIVRALQNAQGAGEIRVTGNLAAAGLLSAAKVVPRSQLMVPPKPLA